MKALCVSGGGSMGAWAGGIVEYLKDIGYDWDCYYGTSTGSLITPLVATNEVKKLKVAYTSITPNDIFLFNPFKVYKSKNGEFKFKLDHLNIIKNFIKNNTLTLGDSSNLKTTIKKFLTKEEFTRIENYNKNVTVSVCNLTTEELELKSSKDETYEDFIDWIMASSSATPFMSLIKKNGYEYADGGILRFIPIVEAVESGANEIDAIVLMESYAKTNIEKIRNVLHLISKLIKILLTNRKKEDVDLRNIQRVIKDDREIILNLYYLPRKITNNPYIFDSEIMKSWWEESYERAKLGPDQIYKISSNLINKLK